MALDPALILANSNLAGALYGELGNTASDTGAAAAYNITAAGDANEANLYDQAAGVGTTNAATELVSGQLQEFQNTRQLMNTIGSQKAGYAGAGFQDSGTTLDVARSSLQQGLLQNQVIGENSNLAAGGYLEQAVANTAAGAAANTAGAAASANAATATTLAGLNTAAAATTSNFINQIPNNTVTATPTGITITPPGGAPGQKIGSTPWNPVVNTWNSTTSPRVF